MQIVLITEGSGVFESGTTGTRPVEAGMGFILLPGLWHRYRPEPATGWTESWIEARGPVVESLTHRDGIATSPCLRRLEPGGGLESALEAVHARARQAEPGFDPELAAAAFGVLAAWETARRAQPARSRILRAIRAAETHFSEHLAEPVNVEALARRLGVAYSHFRRAFTTHTGYSPWKYVLHLRIARARRLLAASDATLEEVAERLGFSSAFHLSTAFKRACGVAPAHWRRDLGRAPRVQ